VAVPRNLTSIVRRVGGRQCLRLDEIMLNDDGTSSPEVLRLHGTSRHFMYVWELYRRGSY
jgi:hypothetical protein